MTLELGSKRSLGRLDGCWVVFGLVVLWGACGLVFGLFGRKKPPAGVAFLRIRQPRPERGPSESLGACRMQGWWLQMGFCLGEKGIGCVFRVRLGRARFGSC